MKNIFIFFLLSIVLLLFGCKGCDSSNFNNKNSDPEKLIIEIEGLSIEEVIRANFGLCLDEEVTSLKAEVNIDVYTASIINGQIVVDEDEYYSSSENVNLDNDPQFTIDVPEDGGYGLSINITLEDCSLCCNGKNRYQCGTETFYDENEEIWYCQGGQLRFKFNKAFSIKTKPPYDLIFYPSPFKAKSCKNCSSCYLPCSE